MVIVLEAIGLVLVTLGVGLWSVPAALIVAGLALVVKAGTLDTDSGGDRRGANDSS